MRCACVCVCVRASVCVFVYLCVCVLYFCYAYSPPCYCPQLVERHLLAKHRAALTGGVTEVEGAPEVSEKLVADSSDQLEQDKSSVLQVEKEDEMDSLSEEAGAEQVCEPVIVYWVTCNSMLNYLCTNMHMSIVLIMQVWRWQTLMKCSSLQQ